MIDFNPVLWITGAPVAFGIIVAAIIAAAVWAYRVHDYHRHPTPWRIADYLMSMPHIHHRFKVTLYALPVTLYPEMMEAFESVAGPELRAAFEMNKGKARFYVAKHLGCEAGTIESGLSILMSEAELDHGEFYSELEESFNAIKGTETRLREVSQSGTDGMVWLKEREWKGEAVNLIYYQARPIVKNPTISPDKLELVKVKMSCVPQMDVWYDGLRKSNYEKLRANSYQKSSDKALSDVKKKTEEGNMIKHAFSLQEYFGQSIIGQAGPLSVFLIIGIVGACAVLLPDMIARQLPGYTPQHYDAFAVGIGAGIVGLISLLRK